MSDLGGDLIEVNGQVYMRRPGATTRDAAARRLALTPNGRCGTLMYVPPPGVPSRHRNGRAVVMVSGSEYRCKAARLEVLIPLDEATSTRL